MQGFIPDDDSQIASIETINTGGHIYNDIIVLKTGHIIRISEDGMSVYRNEKDDDDGNDLWHTSF